MTRRRIIVPVAAVIVVTLLSTALNWFKTNPFTKDAYEHPIGPFRAQSLYLSSPRPMTNAALPNVSGALFSWSTATAQSLLGFVKVRAFSVDAADSTWLSIGPSCKALEDLLQPVDQVVLSPLLSSVSSGTSRFCMMYAPLEQRMYLYPLSVSPARCGRRSVVVARVPWIHVTEEKDGVLSPEDQEENERLQSYQAVASQLVSESRFTLDSVCIAQINQTSAGLWVAASVLLSGVSFLSWRVWHRSRSWASLRVAGAAEPQTFLPPAPPLLSATLELERKDFKSSVGVLHIAKGSEYLGTFDQAEVLRQLEIEGLSPSDFCWRPGMQAWQTLESVLLAPPVVPPPPLSPPQPGVPPLLPPR